MKRVLCIGTLIFDIINAKVKCLPKEGECITADVSLNPGGNAYSTSVNLGRLASENASIYCYGIVGEDDLGESFEKALKREGVISCIEKASNKRTSCNIILQEAGKDRRYIFNEGANTSFSKENVLKSIHKVKPDVLVFGELPSIGLAGSDFVDIADCAKKHYNSLVFLDLLVNSGDSYDWLTGNWNKIDIIHCNLWEGSQVSGKNALDEICKWFMDNGVSLTVVSDGANGCFYGYKDKLVHIAAFLAEEVDATGAGDAMTAGIISRLIELLDEKGDFPASISQETMKDVILFGSACGAIAVGNIGCVSDISRSRVEQLISLNRNSGIYKQVRDQ